MPNENPPVNENECECCELCSAAGDNQLVYCNNGAWATLAAPSAASTLAFDPVDGIKWVPVLGPQSKKPDAGEGA